ncbi:hypothetical protein PENSPDRAFT_690210 [Peniophora sp. CONT]|nr:hypothetical protein PENSPDRAFT_690210 [Peniophora sp. CONT]
MSICVCCCLILAGNLASRQNERAADDRRRLVDIERRIDEHDVSLIVHHTTVFMPGSFLDKRTMLDRVADILLDRFNWRGEVNDVEDAIWARRRAVDFTHDEHPHRLARLNGLGILLYKRFESLRELSDLEAAVAIHHLVVRLTPDGHPDKAGRLNDLANALFDRFDRLGGLNDLEASISAHRRALVLAANDIPFKVALLHNLGISLQGRFARLGELSDLEDAILMHRAAVNHTPDGDPGKLQRLDSLGHSLYVRFERLDNLDDLEKAISVQRHMVAHTPDRHPNKLGRLTDLGNSLFRRFLRLGDLSNLEEAISMHRSVAESTPDSHPDKARHLSNLGNSTLRRFERLGRLDDLEDVISIHRRAVDLIPDGHPDKPIICNSLGNSLILHFQRLGELSSLEDGILNYRRAVNFTPEGHPYKLQNLYNLASALSFRFDRLGELSDLEDCISIRRRVVDLTPDEHSHKPETLNGLGLSLYSRFKRLEELHDNEGPSSLSVARSTSWLALQSRFDRLGELSDIEEGISLHRRAIDLTPDGEPTKPWTFVLLGQSLRSRFNRQGELIDIDEAVCLCRRAVDLTPDGHPRKPACLDNLGDMCRIRFDLLGRIPDFHAAVSSFLAATAQPFGAPFTRLDPAKKCVDLLTAHPTFSPPGSLLEAHAHILYLIPELVWLGHSVNRRYDESARLGNLVHAAVSAAIDAEDLQRAVEWLEAGRSLIWSQVLSLRTPLDELQEKYPKLAESLRDVQQQLQRLAHRRGTLPPDSDPFAGIAGTVENPMASRHRELAIRYDQLLKDIRERDGFGDFLRPKKFASLFPSSPELMSGPVVFIHVHSSRCDAVVVSPDHLVTLVPLADLSLDRAIKLRTLWTEQLKSHGVRMRAVVQTSHSRDNFTDLTRLLKLMWDWIVQPILQALQLPMYMNSQTTGTPLPHMTWCPTGPLAQLPLHASGVYDDPLGLRAFNFVVSSYTPSLSSSTRGCEGVAKKRSNPSVLIVTQPATPYLSALPGTEVEGVRLQEILSGSQIAHNLFNHKEATVAAINDVIDKHSWVHLACHGYQHPSSATKSAFALYDGPLTLSDLMRTAADDAELAFLSACQTATGDEKNPEESAHLAAGMLAVGFKGAVATMWSIGDQEAPVVVEAYYRKLLELRRAGFVKRGETGAAYALHEAVKVLRERVGEENFIKWVPFVHFGV